MSTEKALSIVPRSAEIETPSAPNHLSAEAKAQWRTFHERWIFDEAQTMILRTALEAWDDMQRARRKLKKDGSTFKTPTGQVKLHPASKLLHDARQGYLSAMRQLGLTGD